MEVPLRKKGMPVALKAVTVEVTVVVALAAAVEGNVTPRHEHAEE